MPKRTTLAGAERHSRVFDSTLIISSAIDCCRALLAAGRCAPRPVEIPTAPATFLQGYPQALPRELCEELIARFEKDERKHPSRTATRVNPLVRTGTMLDIPLYPEWADVCNLVTRVTRACLDDYIHRYPMLQSLAKPENCLITPPFIERIEPGQGSGYHIDAGPGGTHDRFVSGLFYLRDIDEGGHTEFPFQLSRIVPRAGMLLLFPPFWTHLHRGVSPARTVKYNISNHVIIRPRADRSIAPASGAPPASA